MAAASTLILPALQPSLPILWPSFIRQIWPCRLWCKVYNAEFKKNKKKNKKHGLLIISPLERFYLSDLGAICLAMHTKKEGRPSARSAVDACLFFLLDYIDHDRDKAEMMTDAAVTGNVLCKIGVSLPVDWLVLCLTWEKLSLHLFKLDTWYKDPVIFFLDFRFFYFKNYWRAHVFGLFSLQRLTDKI